VTRFEAAWRFIPESSQCSTWARLTIEADGALAVTRYDNREELAESAADLIGTSFAFPDRVQITRLKFSEAQ